MMKGGGAKDDSYHECSENPLTPGVTADEAERASGENLVSAQGQLVLAFNCLAKGNEWIPLDLGPSQSWQGPV